MRRSCLGIVALIILLSSCGGSGGSHTMFSPFFPGKWTATIVSSTQGQLANLDMNLMQTADAISSNSLNTIDNLDCDGNISTHMDSTTGTVNGNQFNLVFSVNGEFIALTGTVVAGGKSISGNFTSGGGPCLNGTNGTFTAAFIPPVTGTYTGTLTSVSNVVSNATAMLSEDANFNVSASVVVTNNTCFSSLATIAPDFGMSIGDSTVFDVTDGTNEIDFTGRILQVGSSLSGVAGFWEITGNCPTSGVFQLAFGTTGAMHAPDVNGASAVAPTTESKISPLMVERLKALLAARREK
jgi:hypothetical protein